MSVQIDTLKKVSPLPLDANSMKPDGTPYTTVLEAHQSIPSEFTNVGDVRIVAEGSELVEYWYVGGINFSNLVKKQTKLTQDQLDTLNISKYQYEFLKDLTSSVNSASETPWIPLNYPVTGTSNNGATINLTDKTLAITTGFTGIGSYLATTFNLATFTDLKAGDEIEIKSVLTERNVNTINQYLVPSLSVNSTSVLVSPVIQRDGLVISYTWKITIGALSDILEIRHSIDPNTPAYPANLNMAWVNIFVNYDINEFNSYRENQISLIQKFNTLYDISQKYPVYSESIANGVADDTATLQADINKAISKGRVLVLREGTYRITDKIYINGYLEIRGLGKGRTVIMGDMNTSIFVLQTNRGPLFRDFTFTRNGSLLPTAVLFTNFINPILETKFLNVDFSNIVTGVIIDYADGVLFDGCVFNNGTVRPILWGSVDAYSVKNLTVRNCTFTSVNIYPFEMLSANGVLIENNLFNFSTTVYSDMCIRLRIIAAGDNDYLIIRNNRFYGFEANAIYITTPTTGTLTNVSIVDNIFWDKSASTNSLPIIISGGALNIITGVNISRNTFKNKEYALYTNNVAALSLEENIIIGTTANSRAMLINAGSVRLGSNYITGQQTGYNVPSITGASRLSDTNLRVTTPYTIPSLAAKESVSLSVTVNGALPDMLARSSFSPNLNGRICYSNVESANTVLVTFYNPTNATIGASVSGFVLTRVELNI